MVLVTISPEEDETFAPRALTLLEQIPQNALFNTAHRLRHPASIYRLSLEKIAAAFCLVAEEYLSKTKQNREYNSASLEINQLLKYQADYLHALQEHMDELWMILRTLVDPASAKKAGGEFNQAYVIENKLPGAKSFLDSITSYRNVLRIVNKLKHQQCYLRGVAVWSSLGVHLGYCLEEPDATGFLGPSPDIHPDSGAFSFARDLPWHLAHVYLCSEKLIKTVNAALENRGITLKAKPISSPGWERVVSLACEIPPAIFPKENGKALARFQLDSGSRRLTIKLPHHLKIHFPEPMRARYATVLDDHNLTHKVPQP